MSCFIVDDDPYAIDILKSHIKQTPNLTLLGEAVNPVKALQLIRSFEPSPTVVFLDIGMKQMDGLQLAELLKDKSLIVFTTGHPEYAALAFDLSVADYLVKPVTYARFVQAIGQLEVKLKAVKNDNPLDDFFYIQDVLQKKIVRLRNRDVYYFESFQNYIKIICTDKEYMIYLSLRELEKQLSGLFKRVHKSFIINTNKIVSVDGNLVRLENDAKIGIGDNYREEFFAYLSQRMLRKGQ